MADVKPVTFEQLAEIANRVSPEYATRLLALAGKESTFGKNPAAYKPNMVGAIGPMQILSSQLGGKYGNFEKYAAPGKTDPLNPLHAAEAGMRMAVDFFKTKGVDQGTMDYLGRGKKDALGTTPAGYLQDVNALENQVKTRLQKGAPPTMTTPTTQKSVEDTVALLQDPAYRAVMENAAQLSAVSDATAAAGAYNLGPTSPLGGAIEASARLLAENQQRQQQRFQENPEQSFLERAFSRIVGGFGDAMFAADANEKLKTATAAQTAIANLSNNEKQGALLAAQPLAVTAQSLRDLLGYTQPTANARMQVAEQARQADVQAGFQNRQVGVQERQIGLQEQIQPLKLAEQQMANAISQERLDLAKGQVATQRASVQQFKEAAKQIGITLPDVVSVDDYAKQLSPQVYTAIASVTSTGALGADPQSAIAQSRLIPGAVNPQQSAGWSEFIASNQLSPAEQATVLKQFGLTAMSKDSDKQAALAKVVQDRTRQRIVDASSSGTGAGWATNPYRWDAKDFKAYGSDPRLVAIPGWAGVAAAAANGGNITTKTAVSLLTQGKPLDQATEAVVQAFRTIVNLNNAEVRKFKLMGAPAQKSYKAGQFDLTDPANAQLYITTLRREQQMMEKYRAENPFSSRMDALRNLVGMDPTKGISGVGVNPQAVGTLIMGADAQPNLGLGD